MLGGLRLVSVQQGFDPRDFALVAFGGAGPLHANALGVLTGAWPVIVPPSPGVLCALGDATTSLRDESARTVLRRFDDLDGGELAGLLDELADDAGRRLEEQGLDREEQQVGFQVDVRYHGQGFEIPVQVAGRLARRPRRRPEPARGGLRPRARAAVLLPALGRPRARSTPAPPSPARAPRWPRCRSRPATGAPDTDLEERGVRRRSGRRGRHLRPSRAAGRGRRHRARRSSPRWTRRPWSCPTTWPPSTPPEAC